jgi:ferredoxin
MEVSLDQRRCRGDCICELICPKVFVLDEGGIAHVTQGGTSLEGPDSWAKVPAELESQVMDAVAECPEQAIAVR